MNSKNKKVDADGLAKDDRFSRMFTDKDFVIDKKSDAYKLKKPVIIIYLFNHIIDGIKAKTR